KRGAVDVRHKTELHRAVGKSAQRIVGHLGTQVGAADTDVDHVLDTFARVPLPFPAADAIGERGHLIQHRMYLGDNIYAAHLDLRASWSSQCNVQHRAAFRDVDLLATKHCVTTVSNASLVGQLYQQPNGFIGNSVLRIVEVKAGSLSSQSLAAPGIAGKQLSQVDILKLLVVSLQRTPRRRFRQSFVHFSNSFSFSSCTVGLTHAGSPAMRWSASPGPHVPGS